MPNHCYAQITVEKKYEKKLAEIAKVGLCRYYRPMPEELEQTTSPTRVVSEKEYAKQMKLNEIYYGEKLSQDNVKINGISENSKNIKKNYIFFFKKK